MHRQQVADGDPFQPGIGILRKIAAQNSRDRLVGAFEILRSMAMPTSAEMIDFEADLILVEPFKPAP
ncbi:hypothetical protein L907_19330 [Agrobacterium sp. C13]|nr:hypothetical protein L903_20240 [Agrobacterium sp. JL28]KVK49443.1 hypothetical protein L904_20230 [Agrobacterium sp. LY4]KVK62526.1 hypothetical protein L906_19355 [Agrobacterium sp. TS45]KVK67060.1 hypothetical protein L907_19330 [Agrobacterium sp. C13]